MMQTKPKHVPVKQFTRNSEDNKLYKLTDCLNNNSCYFCMTKSCKRTDKHGEDFPTQFCTFVKYPTNIETIKKAIQEADLFTQFEGYKPFYIVCKNIHKECQNCNDLRVKFIDNNKIALCYGTPFPNSTTITVGVHIDLKLIVRPTSYYVEPIYIEIDGEKLIENFTNKHISDDEKSFTSISTPVKSIVIDDDYDNHNNKSTSQDTNQNNNQDNNNLFDKDELEIITINSNDNNDINNNNNFDTDFPGLSPTPTNTSNISSPINFTKIRERAIQKLENETKVNSSIINNNDTVNDDPKKILSTEITNSLLDKENSELKSINERLEINIKSLKDKIKLYEEKLKSYEDRTKFAENKLKENEERTSTLIKTISDPHSKKYLEDWIKNMYTINTKILDIFNNTNYMGVDFVEELYNSNNNH